MPTIAGIKSILDGSGVRYVVDGNQVTVADFPTLIQACYALDKSGIRTQPVQDAADRLGVTSSAVSHGIRRGNIITISSRKNPRLIVVPY